MFEHIRDVLGVLDDQVGRLRQDLPFLGQRVNAVAISDAIVLSGEASDVVESTSVIAFHLLQKGAMLRGAITQGKIFHEGNRVFGPALNEAYYRERAAAIYPRIIVDDAVANALRNDFRSEGIDAFLKDQDGVMFLNLLTPNWIGLDEETSGAHELFLRKIRDAITDNLERYRDCNRIYLKTIWYANYFNDTLKNHKDLLVGHNIFLEAIPL